MANFVRLTNRNGTAVHVNLDLVEYIQPNGAGATLYFTHLPWFSTDKLTVRESPEDIVRRSGVTS